MRRIIRSGEMMTLSSDRHFGYATVVRSFAKHSWRSYAPHIAQNERSEILRNVPAYAMFASGIIARSAYHWQIWVEACGGTEQAVTAYAVLADVFLFFCFLVRKPVLKNFKISFSVLDFGQRGQG